MLTIQKIPVNANHILEPAIFRKHLANWLKIHKKSIHKSRIVTNSFETFGMQILFNLKSIGICSVSHYPTCSSAHTFTWWTDWANELDTCSIATQSHGIFTFSTYYPFQMVLNVCISQFHAGVKHNFFFSSFFWQSKEQTLFELWIRHTENGRSNDEEKANFFALPFSFWMWCYFMDCN